MTVGFTPLARLLTACAALAVGTVAGQLGHVAHAATPSQATISVINEPFPDDAIAQGATFKVRGEGWSPGSLVQVEVCGAEARSGSSDCAVATAQILVANDSGIIQGRLSVVVPPSPCPCVVRAFTQDSDDIATTPIEIPGAPTDHPGDGTVTAPALRRVAVQKVVLRGSDTFATWWGAPAHRTLEFEVVNTGSVAIDDASISLRAGPTDDPNGFVPPVKIDRLEVGESKPFSVPIEFPALSFGEQRVIGTVNGTSQPTVFAASTTTHPWLLIIVPSVIILQLLLLLTRNIVRRRLHDAEADDAIPEVATVADDSLICVVEVAEPALPNAVVDTAPVDDIVDVEEVDTDTDTDTPPDTDADADADVLIDAGHISGIRNRTVVLQSIQSVQELVLRSLQLDEMGEPIPDQPVINSITILADADAKVGLSYHACDQLCDWIETTFAESLHPETRSLTLRRHVNPGGNANPSAASGMGMVPLSVMVRAPHVRAMAS